ncbi:MAG: hypothetical protein ACYTG6_09585 [Planctomycetota bacterium]|jgi:hypothetical protein
MISFRDMTFCTNPDCKCSPGRRLTDEVKAAAERWWGGPGAPIACADLCKGEAREEEPE